MPNWSEASMAVFLPTKNADKFLDLFLAGDAEIDKNKKEFFSRTFIISKDKEIKDDMALLKIEFESAWSIYSCMMKEENDKNKNCLTLKEAIDKYEVERIVIKAIETGISFEESIVYDRKFYNDISYQSRELYLDPAKDAHPKTRHTAAQAAPCTWSFRPRAGQTG